MSALIESLENRTLMTAVDLGGIIGPLKAGATYQYNIELSGSPDVTEVDHVVSTTFKRFKKAQRAIAIEKTYTSGDDGSTSLLDQYLSASSKGEYVYGQVESGELDTVTTKYSPALVQLPTHATPGRVYRFHYTATQSIRINSTGETREASFAITDHVTLSKGKPFSLTVSGHSFQVYEVGVDETSNGVTTHAESWFSPGIGLVQTVSDGGSISLTSFTP